ncbi:hypothetical protein [Marininema halotolerans]|nr:hypothetical protein [Marininema halotolerans]
MWDNCGYDGYGGDRGGYVVDCPLGLNRLLLFLLIIPTIFWYVGALD